MPVLRLSSILAAAVAASVATPAVAAEPPQARAARSGGDGEVSLWRGATVACPATASASARPGAVVGGDHEECFLLTHRVLTLDRVEAAHVGPEPGGLHWEVDLTLPAGRRRALARITSAAIGHELAVLDDGHLMSAPLVMDPITNGSLTVDGLDESEAQGLAQDLQR